MKYSILACLTMFSLILIKGNVSLANDISQKKHSEITSKCVFQAAIDHNVPYWAIVSILSTEGGKVGMKIKNTNNTFDYGPMQINSIWLPHLKKKKNITERDLRYNGCINISVGAWILSKNMEQYDFWKAVGAYHSRTPYLNATYQEKVYQKAKKIKNSQNVNKIIEYANSVF